MSLGEKFEAIADIVYDKGVHDGLNEAEIFFTNNYKRQNYMGAFLEANMTGYEFAQTIYPITGIEKIFYAYVGTELPKNIDLSKLDCSKSETYYRNAFGWLNNMEYLPDIGLPAIPYYTSTFSNSEQLKKIEVIRCNKNTVFKSPFVGCTNLTEFRIEGEIGTTFDCSQSPVSPETMLSVLNHLCDYVGTADAHRYSVLFSEKCWKALNDAYPDNPTGLPSWGDWVVAERGWNI